MIRIGLTLLLIAVSSPGGEQTPQQSPAEVTAHDEIPTFKTAVNVVEVPVVVRDYRGRAVGNLTQDDFQLFDRGKSQRILKFAVEKSEGSDVMVPVSKDRAAEARPAEPIPAAVMPERFVAYLFDDVHVAINDLVMARDAADRHMKRMLGPKTRAAIFTTSGQTMLDFAGDREKLHDVLFQVQVHPVARPIHGECPDLTYEWADLIRNHNDAEALYYAEQMAAACSGAGGSGKGYNGQSVPDSTTVRAAVGRIIAAHEQEDHIPMGVLRDLVKRMSVLPGERTVVLASPGFMTIIGSKEEETTIIDRAIRARVVINSLDVRGLATDVPDISKSRGLTGPVQAYVTGMEHNEFNAQMDVLAEVAYGTGGTFYHNNNDLDTGFDRVAGNPEYRYILGFAPSDLKLDGSLHALKVSIVNNTHHYDVDARRSYTAPKRLDDPVEQAKQEINDAVFSRDELHDIPIELHAEYFKIPPSGAKVTIATHIDLKALKLRKAEGRNHDNLTVTTALFDNNGNYVTGIQRGVELRLKDDTFDKWMANGIQVRSNLEVKAGTYLVRVVVRDTEGQLMATRNGSVDIP